jgi:hypothetical protein
LKRLVFSIPGICLAVAALTGVAIANTLPVYPGATKMAYAGPTTFVRCGHKISVVTYDSSADVESIGAWYSDRIPGGIHVRHNATSTAALTMTEIFEPDGVGAVAISRAAGSGVHIGLGTYEPALSPADLQTMRALMGSDSPAKQRAIASMKAKCGPNRTGGI